VVCSIGLVVGSICLVVGSIGLVVGSIGLVVGSVELVVGSIAVIVRTGLDGLYDYQDIIYCILGMNCGMIIMLII
ncbi:MAG TPA: hypothetical protein PLI74_14335, partial [Candidatus Kapabacteria bacterium]|nr:hypothetical protein [Candidatus Kapabacteria bacterium]